MKLLKISILCITLAGFALQVEGTSKTTKAGKQVKGAYQELVEQYETLIQNFEKLEKQREIYEAKNPSRDEMAKLDVQIADIRAKANEIYAEMEEFPQFSTYEGQVIPASPKYERTDKEYKECVLKSKELNKDVKKLTKDIKKK